MTVSSKSLSDTHDWERGQAVAEYGEDVPPEVEADYHRFAVPTGTHWREVTTKTDNLGARSAPACPATPDRQAHRPLPRSAAG